MAIMAVVVVVVVALMLVMVVMVVMVCGHGQVSWDRDHGDRREWVGVDLLRQAYPSLVWVVGVWVTPYASETRCL